MKTLNVTTLLIVLAVGCGDNVDKGPSTQGDPAADECAVDSDCFSDERCASGRCLEIEATANDDRRDDEEDGNTGDEENNTDEPDPVDDETDEPAICMGDFSIRESIFYNSDQTMVGAECDDPLQPQNCADGMFTTFGNGDCVCTPACSSYGLDIGDPCTSDGQWTCQVVEGDRGSSAALCTHGSWNLCRG